MNVAELFKQLGADLATLIVYEEPLVCADTLPFIGLRYGAVYPLKLFAKMGREVLKARKPGDDTFLHEAAWMENQKATIAIVIIFLVAEILRLTREVEMGGRRSSPPWIWLRLRRKILNVQYGPLVRHMQMLTR